jgi:DNA-binding IclR family transcriptional regulator
MPSSPNISISRLFEILEVFSRERRPLTATFLQEITGCPRSSLNLLLKSAVSLGYLTIHKKTNSYFPCIQLAQLTAWVVPTILQDRKVGSMLDDLRQMTDESVLLCMRSDMNMEIVRVATSSQAIALIATVGDRFPIWGSAVGMAALSSLSNIDLKLLYYRSSKLPTKSLNETKNVLKATRIRGYSASYSAVREGVGAIAAPLPITFAGRELVLSIGGPEDRISKNEKQLGEALAKYISDYTKEQKL